MYSSTLTMAFVVLVTELTNEKSGLWEGKESLPAEMGLQASCVCVRAALMWSVMTDPVNLRAYIHSEWDVR